MDLELEALYKWIDAAEYETLLRRWRFAPCGDPLFQGAIGEYYSKIMFKKRDELGANASDVSKRIGW